MAINIKLNGPHRVDVCIYHSLGNSSILYIWNKYDWFNVRTELGWP